MKKTAILFGAGVMLAAAPAIAQDAAAQVGATVETTAVVQPAAGQASVPVARILPASTAVLLAADSEITSKKVEVGDKFTFTVVNDVVENGVVAVPRGSKVQSTITWKTGKAVGGKSGKFELSFDSINVRGRDYKMRGTHRQEGKGNTVAAVFATWLISGRSAVMLSGQNVTMYTDEPIPY